jgi:hypothetical protein
MDTGNDAPRPKTLPRRTWNATLREQIFHQREHTRALAMPATSPAAADDAAVPGRIPPQS